MKSTELQRLSRQQNWAIRLLCGIYAQAKNCSYLTAEESKAIVTICDNALKRIRGESEKRKKMFDNIENGC